MTPIRIFFVRHGESAGNVDKRKHHELADHAIPLTERGRDQALASGRWLGKYLLDQPLNAHRTRLWVSPYARTRQTADAVEEGISAMFGELPEADRPNRPDRREHINLVEQQFGLFDGVPDDQLASLYPNEAEHYNKQMRFEGRFWARMPLGESRFDVALRVHQAFGTFHRDYDKQGIDQLIVVSHSVTIRAFQMQWLHRPFEWIEKERNPPNASIQMIYGQTDHGVVFVPPGA
jgi:2,3-bisphosphoglycerate-dependent phosphoglycerate mutase